MLEGPLLCAIKQKQKQKKKCTLKFFERYVGACGVNSY